MLWVLIAWGAVVVLSVVVLGFCAYEVIWKAKRLTRDLETLRAVSGELQSMAKDLATAQQRVASARAGD